MMPLTTFHPLRYKQLIDIATGTNNFPDVVGQIRMFQGNDLKNPRATTEVRLGLLLNMYRTFFLKKMSKMVRLTIMDNVCAQFRDLHSMTVMKYKVVIFTSINPTVFKGKLILATTPAIRFYCDSTIDLIQSFIRRNK
ncbi:hypothetical protein IGI04_014793, partial [Brassica rapa subsp. trilocularis]